MGAITINWKKVIIVLAVLFAIWIAASVFILFGRGSDIDGGKPNPSNIIQQ